MKKNVILTIVKKYIIIRFIDKYICVEAFFFWQILFVVSYYIFLIFFLIFAFYIQKKYNKKLYLFVLLNTITINIKIYILEFS